MAVAIHIFEKILDFIPEKPIGIYQMSYATKLDARTIRRYLEIIELIQQRPKIKKEIIGSRVFFKRER